jgi:hypothetical protein
MVRGPGCIGVVFGDAQIGLVRMMVQPVEDVGASLIVAEMTRVAPTPAGDAYSQLGSI